MPPCPRAYCPPLLWQDGVPQLPADEAHHLVHVLRLKPGDEADVFDGEGREARVALAGSDARALRVHVLSTVRVEAPAFAPELLIAVPKGDRMDWLVQKATELGVRHVQPVECERSVVRLAGDRGEGRRERWERIAVGAAKQSGARFMPRVYAPRPVLDVLDDGVGRACVVAGSLEPDAQPLADVMAGVRRLPGGRVAALIGPEGDFSSAEYAAMRRAGVRAVSFGPRILRTETAAVYLLAVFAYELGAWGAGRAVMEPC